MVRPRSPDDSYRLERGAEARGWMPEAIGRDRYKLAIPLYCARRVSARACREELADFSQTVVPLWVDEIRLRDSVTRDRRRVAQAHPSMERRGDALWQWLRGGAQWEVAVERAVGANPKERLKDEEARASRLLARTRLGGPRQLCPVRARLAMEPAQIQGENMSLVGRLLNSSKVFLPALLVLASAVFVGSPTIQSGWIFAAYLAGLSLAAWLGWWTTGSHAGHPRRWLGPVVGIGMFMYLAWVCSLAWQQRPPAPTDGWLVALLRAGVAVLAGFLLIRGWKHLHILRPEVRSLWSFGAMSFLISASAASGSVAVWALLRAFDLRAEDLRDWQMVAVLAALGAGLFALSLVVLTGAIRGWAEYYRLWFSKGAVSDLMWMATWPMVVVLAVLFVLNFGARLLSGIPVQLTEGEGLIFDLGLVDRVCVSVSDDDVVLSHNEGTTHISVIRGNEDRLHGWRADGVNPGEMPVKCPGGKFVPVASSDLVMDASGACSYHP